MQTYGKFVQEHLYADVKKKLKIKKHCSITKVLKKNNISLEKNGFVKVVGEKKFSELLNVLVKPVSLIGDLLNNQVGFAKSSTTDFQKYLIITNSCNNINIFPKYFFQSDNSIIKFGKWYNIVH